MGMSVSSGSSSRVRGTTTTTLAEINVTPLVDVMLVLLIVFMISAPLMQQGIQVDLPRATATTMTDVPDTVTLIVNKNRQILMNDKILPQGTLRSRLEAIQAAKPDVQLYIQGDQGVPYGFIAQVMAEVKRAKINRVGLVTEPGDNAPRI